VKPGNFSTAQHAADRLSNRLYSALAGVLQSGKDRIVVVRRAEIPRRQEFAAYFA
jgi:hypothetical protein